MLSVPKARTPVKSRTSDVFWINESPQKNNSGLINQGIEKEDSFLVMMGIDNDIDDENSKLGDSLTDKKWDKNRVGRTEAEKNITKASTPLNNKSAENFGLPSPISINVCNENEPSNEVYNNPSCKPSSVNSGPHLDSKSVEELKDFFKLSLSEISDNNRDYFLHIMMALTKEKLYLQKQLSNMSEQMQNLLQNQNALIETNRRLTYEIEQLKSRQQSHKT
ncbi:hypothetical protein EVAR_48396_1 [Eumeta japonica]|uniref:Uncharacterized protein n=1 Tax=Eumeta variegata TaxID=151549 RepID=A0A4C1ZDM8_EUMVA|nr:hypothetical protein EVAR_48396_1 [Eumeta japonica]